MRLGRRYCVAVKPARDVVVIELLAPYHSGERLPHQGRLIVARVLGGKRRIILVGFAAPIGMDSFEVRRRDRVCARHVAREAKPELDRLAGPRPRCDTRSHFCALPRRIYRRRAMNDVVVDAVLRIGRLRSGDAVKVPGVGFVFTEQQRRRLSGRIRPGSEAPAAQQFLFRDRADVATCRQSPG